MPPYLPEIRNGKERILILTIENNTITLTRGDSAYITVNLTAEDGTAYQMQEGDKLRLAVRERAEDHYTVLFEAESDTETIYLPPSATGNVDAGKYSCDIQLETAAGDVFTVFGAESEKKNLKNFILCPEVTK